jgi:N-acyl-D-amino-acid deacylase
VLGEYVGRRRVLPLAEAVRKMTSLPAQHFRLNDRGRVHAGYAADLVLLSAGAVRDAATFESPHAYAEGMPYVLVNGIVVVRSGEHTRARPGQALSLGHGAGGRALGANHWTVSVISANR